MKSQVNWSQIKLALKENFIEQKFQQHSSDAFIGVDFDKGLEIFRYILEKRLPNHDETTPIFEALHLYKEKESFGKILKGLATKYEPFAKKILDICNIPYTQQNSNRPKPPALAWCCKNLFNKQPSPVVRGSKDRFYSSIVTGKISSPTYLSDDFKTNFLTDGTSFGKELHSAYHIRNSIIHNDPNFKTTDTFSYVADYITCYLYFTFKYYNELLLVIPPDELVPVQTLTIRNLASLSGGAYNPDINNEVKRDNIIQTIENKIKDLDVLFIEGEEGIGKTTILHQFVAKHPNSCLAYFIDSKDSNTYSNLAILQALNNQLCFKIKQDVLEDLFPKEYYDEDFLKKYFTTNYNQLVNNKTSGQTFYFIIDGLDEVSRKMQDEIGEQILDNIPYDKQNIKLILSGLQNRRLLRNNSSCDKLEISFLPKSDSYHIFGSTITLEQFDEINRISQNNAGKITFFRDLVSNTQLEVDNIIDKISPNLNLKDLYQYLWDNYNNSNSGKISKLLLSLLAFHHKKYNAEKLGEIIGIEEDEVLRLIRSIPFVRKNSRGTYEYIFDGFASFAKKKLSSYSKQIDKIIIDYLIGLDSIESLVDLPAMYSKTGNKGDLLKLLSNENWNRLLQKSEKISVVSRVSNITLETIQNDSENKYIPTLLKYSVLKSALKELGRTTVWQYEIAASLVLGDYIGAGNLANIAFFKEDKLRMFASIARAYTERKEQVPYAIQRKIQEIYEDIDASKDFENIKESAVEIASLLMYSNPKLAFRLIEDLSGTITDNDNAFDWALAQISLSVHSNIENLEDVSKEDVNTKVYSKIRNPKIKALADAILYLSENQTSEEIIDKIKELESTSQKMFLIRNWIGNNQKDDNVAEIIELGLKLIVDKSDKYVPKASDYKTFVMPLPYIKNKDKACELINKIEQYVASIESNSTTNDLLIIKLFIVRALCNFEFEKGEEKLLEIYDEIDDLSENQQKSTKCNCLAIYANAATQIANAYPDRELDMYLNAARQGIKDNIDYVLGQTASHFEIVQSIITNLARLYPDDAIEICQKLNKSIDRDNAFLETLSTYLKQDLENIDTETVDKLLNSIADLDIQKIAISEIINKLEGNGDIERELLFPYKKYFSKVDSLIDNRVKCLLYVKIISLLEKNGEDFKAICDKLKQTWNELEKSVFKIELGFEIAYNAAFLKNKDFAKSLLHSAKSEKDEPDMLLDSPNTTEVFSLVTELTTRIFTGLVVRGNYEQSDIEKIEKIINTLPSEIRQMSAWASLILRIIPKSEDDKFAKELIGSYIIPKLSKIKNKNERISAIMEIIVALYFYDNSVPYLEELPNQKLKDIALSKICKYLFTRCLPNEECDNNDEGYSINHETVERILGLTNLMGNDYFIAAQIMELRRSIFSKNTTISGQKKIQLKIAFEKIASSKLPDQNNIKHLGYQLLVKANALAINSRQKETEWETLLREVESIPNLSDKIFLWNSIVELLPNNLATKKHYLIKKSIESAYNLPSFLDTVERIEMILLAISRKNIAEVSMHQLMQKFLNVIRNNPHNPSLRENYKNILDVVHSTSPEMAKTMINTLDNDPARLRTGAYLNNHYNLLEFQSKLQEKVLPNQSHQSILENNPNFFLKIIDKKLARLNASNNPGDKQLPKDLTYQLKMASRYSISESHNVYSYFIERLILTYEDTTQARKIIHSSFSELLEVCNLIKLLSIRNADKIKSLLDVMSVVNEEDFSNSLTVDSKTIDAILVLQKVGKTAQEIAVILEIDIDTVESVQK